MRIGMRTGWESSRRRLGTALALVSGLGFAGCGEAPRPPARPHIVLITVESLRPDHVRHYQGQRDTTPNLDAFAREAMIYEDAHAVTSWTLASHASLFTGLYPSAHGAVEPRSQLGDDASTLAELLAAKGYQTAGFATGPYLARSHNLDQGFEYYDDSPATVGSQGAAHDDVTNPQLESAIRRFLERDRDPARPLFLFAYFWDPHYDYIPPAPYDTMFVSETAERVDVRGYESSSFVTAKMPPAQLEYVVSQYDGEIRWTDEYLGRLFRLLREQKLWDDSVVIVTSDHGEEFFDHGQKGHKRSLYVESVHVPLVVKYRGSERAGRDARLVSLVDVFPTVLSLAGVEPAPPSHGRSLLEDRPDPDRPVFFELLSTFYHRRGEDEGFERRDTEWAAVRVGQEKLVVVSGTGSAESPGQAGAPVRLELYDVGRDPREQLDLAIERPDRVAALRRLLDDFRAEARALRTESSTPEPDLSPDHLERLRALGYLDEPQPAAGAGIAADEPATAREREPAEDVDR
jgi:arylsulfatase A-like enzyme